jgi:uncharacterized membrane protein
VTAAETGAAEGVERIVPLGSEMDIAIRYCYCCVIGLMRDVCGCLESDVYKSRYKELYDVVTGTSEVQVI